MGSGEWEVGSQGIFPFPIPRFLLSTLSVPVAVAGDTYHQAHQPIRAPVEDALQAGAALPGVGGDLAGAGGDGPLETPFEVGRKARVADEDVGLPGQQQAERVDVGRADGGPVFVDDRHLGVQMAAVVFEDSHAVGEKLAVEGAGGVLLQGVVGPALREQGEEERLLFSFFFSDRARIMSGNRRIGRKRVRIVK